MGSKILYLLLGLFCSGIFFTPAVLADTVLDQFSSVSYANNNGTVSWASDWIEIIESDGANAGDVRVTGGELRVQGNYFTGGDKGVSREVDLLGATSATLSFQYRRNRLDDVNDYVTISVSANGGISWTELERFAGPNNDGNNQPASYDISGYVAANTMIRFLSSPNLGYLNWPSNDRVYFDDVQIEFTRPTNPLVSAISRVSTNPSTAGTTVDWLVTFDQAVTGVDATDFTLIEAGGAGGATIISVTGSGTSWTVTADSGTSDTGTLGLNLVDDDSIRSAASLPLGGAGVGNGNFVGEVYTLIPPVPVLGKTASASAAVLGDVVSFTITATNLFDVDLTSVVLTDTLPAGMSYVTHVTSLGSAINSGQDVVWTIPTLPAGGSAQLILAVSLTQQGSLTNTVTAPGATAAGATVLVLASAVTHFRMDETVGSWNGTAGEVIDTGGTTLHGRRLTSSSPTTTNVIDPLPTIDSQHPSVVGNFCNSGFFDGRAIVEVADSPLFDYTTQLSASAWIYPTAYPPSELYSILSNDVNYEFHINSAGRLYWWWNASTLTSNASIPLNQWTHIAITFDSSAGVRRQRIYINGVQDSATNNWQGTLAANNCNFYIGGDVATGAACSILPARNFRGRIDEVKLYGFELNAAEVVADMTLGRSCSGTFDHVRIEHDGNGSICTPEKVTLKACFNADCTVLYPGAVTVNLSPSGWVGGNTFTFSGGIASRQLGVGTPGNVTLGTPSVVPAPAGTTRCFNGISETCTLNFAAASCNFDAVETGAAPQTPIFTKLANTPFALDVLALLDATTLNTGYDGTVAVDLVDSSAATCPTGPGLTAAQNISFVAADLGRRNVAFAPNFAAPNVRVRATLGASAPACSADNFAIRPLAFTLSSSDATNTFTNGTTVITAGAPFQLSAAAVIGYNGIPTIDNSKLTGTPIAGVLSGVFSAANPLTGTASGAGFSYSEVGHFGLNANAVFDANFTQVDQPNDCLAGFSNTLSAGRYGCSIGSTAVPFAVDNSGFGRFIPARFNLSANTPRLLPACNGFTYLGQPFDYLTSPQLTLTAQNTGGATTLNYDGSYWKHSSNLSGHSYTSNAASSATLTITTAGSVAWNGIADSDGVGRANLSGEFLAYTKPAASEPPFEADVNLTFSAVDLTDSDGVCYDPDINGICNPFTISNITGSEQRYGQMQLQNAYGPETLPLTIPVFTEYFDGTGFVLNVSDICTTYDSLNATLANPQGNLALNETAITGNGTLISGVGNNLSLAAPGVGNDGSADVTLDLSQATGANMQWLQPGGINPNPNARATFGIFRGNDRLIYMRESIW
jgi:uncharacterized repeat protein (TIGR01451 family)